MICVYDPTCTDFSTNGLGPVSPESARVTETLNGEYELTLVHPLDDAGKWRRLAEGYILRAPVPAAMTPQVSMAAQTGGGTMIYKVSTNRDPLRLRSGTGTKYKILGKYKKGTQVIVLAKTTSSWYEVSCPDGKRGYMSASYLTHVRTDPAPGQAAREIMESRQLRDQPFRIYRVVPELDKVTVYARHVFYDLLDNMVKSYKPSASATGAAVVAGISGTCLSEHDFTFYSDLDSTAEEVEFVNKNPVDAILGEDGLVAKYGGELARDWFDVFLVKRVGTDSQVQIRQGKNLLGITYDVDITDVVTRIMPTGEDKDGNVLYLPEGYVDSPHIGDYTQPKWIHLAVSGAREVTKGKSQDKKSKAQCYNEMRQAAQAEFDKGCDLPTITLKVDFINCAETEEYRQYNFLQNIFLGDSVRVIAGRIGVAVSMRMTQYTYDCLTRKYTDMTLGTVADTVEGNMISARQLGNGIITGAKLAINSVGSGQLQDGSVGSLQIQLAAIQAAHIEDAAIGKAHIQEAAIGTAQIEDLAVTGAKIAEAAIESANIAEAAIHTAHIKDGAIETAKINDAAITTAKIGNAAITEAKLEDAAVTTAKIHDLAVDTGKIADAAIVAAKIAQAVIQSGHIEDAAITRAKIALLAVDEARIADLAVGTAKIHDAAITTAKINDLAVTGAKIANATITSANIADATIGTAKIALGAITTALIEAGAVGTAQIADASVTDAKIVELSANRITTGTLSVERLIIVGGENSIVYTINSANGTPQLSQATIDGGSLTQRSISADRIVAGAITANEIAAATILANNIASGAITTDKMAAEAVDASKIKAGVITTNHLAANFGQNLDLSSNTGINLMVSNIQQAAANALNRATNAETAAGEARDAVSNLKVGGVNLIEGSASFRLVADGADAYWNAADELEPATTYTLSVKEVTLEAGQAAGVTWKIVNHDTGALHTSGMLDFTYGRQVVHFTTPESSGNWSLYLYAGISSQTTGVTVLFTKIKLEEGAVATSWSAAPEDTSAAISQVSESVEGLDAEMDTRVRALIDSLGLSEQFASASDFLAALGEIELIRSDLAQQDSNMTLTYTRLSQTEAGLAQLFSSFTFGDDAGTPYLDMATSDSAIKMRLTNTRLAFVQGGTELAYFSDNKLYVTRLEAVEQISIGTSVNGYLDIVTTPTGVGFKWRN